MEVKSKMATVSNAKMPLILEPNSVGKHLRCKFQLTSISYSFDIRNTNWILTMFSVIACVKPAVLINSSGRLWLVVPVANHHLRSSHRQLPVSVCRQLSPSLQVVHLETFRLRSKNCFAHFSTESFHCIFIMISMKNMEKKTNKNSPAVGFHGNGGHIRF